MNALAKRGHLPDRPDTAVLCATIVIAPELFGGAFPWTVVIISGFCVASLGTALWVRRSAAAPVVDGVLIAMGLAWLWTCLQAVPLPSALASALDLGSVRTAERLQGLAWGNTVPFTVSYDPGSTQLQILIGISILSAFLAARLGGPSGLKPIAIATVASAVLIGLVGFAHRAVGANVLFGIYSPRFSATHVLTPLLNSNHLGGFSLMGALIAAGLAAQEGGRPKRFAWVSASVLCTTVVAFTLSRGAIGGLLFGFVLLATWLVRSRRSDGRRAAIPVAIVGGAVAGVVAFAGLEPILRRFETHGLGKLELAADGFRLLDGSAWWLGVGRGAFSSAFVTHQGSLDRYTHPENLLVQWTTEWGILIAGVLLLALTPALWKRFRTAEKPLVAAVCVAIFALSLQNLVDFSLEMAGVVAVVAALLGALLPVQSTSRPQPSRKLSLASFGVFVTAIVALGPRVLASDTQSIVDRLTRAMEADDGADFQATLRRGLALHPGEPAFALLAGTYSGSKRHPDAARWLSVVIEEAPGWAAPHAVAARWLFAEGRIDQALLEIHEAEQLHAGRGHKVLCEILTRYPRMEHIERAEPAGAPRIAFLNRTTSWCPGLPPELRAQIDTAILKDEPAHPRAVLRQAQRLATQERSDDAIALLQRALDDNADDTQLWVAIIEAHLSGGDAERAESALKQAGSRALDSRALLEAQARVEAALGQTDAMRATLARLRGQSRGDARLIASSFILGGELEASLGNIDEALAAYTAADVANPESPGLQYAATLALKSERPTHARRLYRTLCRRKPGGPACAQEARLSKEPGPAPPERAMP
jgi:tetratricopeptide (TPR) repeat protein